MPTVRQGMAPYLLEYHAFSMISITPTCLCLFLRIIILLFGFIWQPNMINERLSFGMVTAPRVFNPFLKSYYHYGDSC